MVESATMRMVLFGLKVSALDWTSSQSAREAFKAEYQRMQTDATRRYQDGY